jgi:hypothetical protein
MTSRKDALRPDAPPFGLARRRGKQAAHAFVLALAVAFVGSSALQLVRAIFFGSAGGSTAALRLDPECSDGVRRLVRALDRANAAVAASSVARHGSVGTEDVAALFHGALSPEWDGAAAVEKRCAARGGEGAWTALERLRSAEEQLARRTASDLAPLRDELAAHLGADLR